MQTKLTVRINDRVIKRAKAYARRHKTSVSKLIENQLEEVTAKDWKPAASIEDLPPLVKSIMGVMKGAKDFDWKKEKEDYLYKKYVK